MLDRAIEEYSTPKKQRRSTEALFLTAMDKALLLTWRSRELSQRKLTPPKALETDESLKNALEIYLELDRNPEYMREALLKFRLSNLLNVTGNSKAALEEIKQAVSLLPKDKRIPNNHVLQISIRRQCSYLLWRAKQAVWDVGAKKNDYRYKVGEQIELLGQSRSLIQESLKRFSSVANSAEVNSEYLRIWNNFICFSWDMRDLGHPVSFTKDDLNHMAEAMKRIEKSLSRYSRKLTALDTLVKGTRLLNDLQAFKRLMPQFVKELNLQKRTSISSDGYTSQELTYITYCVQKLKRPHKN